MLRTSNPALNTNVFSRQPVAAESAAMTIPGVVQKTATLLFLLFMAAIFSWNRTTGSSPESATPLVFGGLLGGMILGFVIIFKQKTAPFLSPIYALCEGLLLGALSAITEAKYPGIVISAVGLTFGTLASLLMLYASRVIRPTENMKLGIAAATGGICLAYFVSMLLRLFGLNMPFIHDTGPIGIGISVFVVIVAALNLVLDFDFIESGVAGKAPRYMEWYAAFGLMVTLVWLYLEILRLLSKMRKR